MFGVKLCVLFCLFLCPLAYVLRNDDEGELLLVSVIFRHGARTTYSFYPNDPYKNETFYPFGKGHLTNEGKLGEYKLGRYLKSLYGEFLGEDYTEGKVYVRSTDVTRTKMSAQLVLAGLFPPSQSLVWNENLLWLPIPVSYKPDSEEDLFHPLSNCPYKIKVLSELSTIPKVQEIFIEPFQEIYEYIETNSGKSMKQPSDMQDIFFILKCEADMNYTLPDWTQEVYPAKVETAASYVYAYHNYDSVVKQINSGYLLKKILDDSDAKISNAASERKIYLYSGHESTVGYMLDALGVQNKTVIPAYGSAISFELRKLEDEYYIRMRYRSDPEATTSEDLNIPGCAVMCPVDSFKSILSNILPSKTIQEACKV
ncbi:venom acid phosphatase Acph-1 [Anoplophora glabripennis]|uniref:venom acid phosphatase Acph-1 n=1 Tax=Anoplophora glabripennis TaxID=217634 RepID=UPI000873DA82|nr:venom acid phosphatase Acph-1 [Anoplophora glabripennis]